MAREFRATECCVFFKTREQWGQFSNMCGGFPIEVGGWTFRTSEALYQALRFPDHPAVQEQILRERSPMGGKFVAKREVAKTRPDWMDVRVDAMRYAVAMKISQHPELGAVFAESEDREIVERSRKDPFWGALLDEPTGVLTGDNVLGFMIKEMRESFRRGNLQIPAPPLGSRFLGAWL